MHSRIPAFLVLIVGLWLSLPRTGFTQPAKDLTNEQLRILRLTRDAGLISKLSAVDRLELKDEEKTAKKKEIREAHSKLMDAWSDALLTKKLFPCDIAKKDLVKLHLTAEIHTGGNSESAKIRAKEAERAIKGDIFWGVEGFSPKVKAEAILRDLRVDGKDYDQKKSKVFGIENTYTQTLSNLMTYRLAVYPQIATIREFANTNAMAFRSRVVMMQLMMQSDGLKTAWSNIGADFAKHALHDVIQDASKLERSKDDRANLLKLMDRYEDELQGAKQDWMRPYRALMVEMHRLRFADTRPKADFQPYLDFLDGKAKNLDINDLYASDLRTLDWMPEIARLYCNALEAGKDMHVNFGVAHLGTLYRLIERHSQGNVPIEIQIPAEASKEVDAMWARAAKASPKDLFKEDE